MLLQLSAEQMDLSYDSYILCVRIKSEMTQKTTIERNLMAQTDLP